MHYKYSTWFIELLLLNVYNFYLFIYNFFINNSLVMISLNYIWFQCVVITTLTKCKTLKKLHAIAHKVPNWP